MQFFITWQSAVEPHYREFKFVRSASTVLEVWANVKMVFLLQISRAQF